MNTGVAFMTQVRVQRLNSTGEILYEESLSVLDSFGEYKKLTPYGFSLLSVELATQRFEAFIQWIKTSYLNTSLQVTNKNSYIDLQSKSCPLPNSNWEIKDSVYVETTLKRSSNRGTVILATSFDAIETVESSYRLDFRLLEKNSIFDELDYLKGEQGELIYKSQVERSKLVFDVNSKGELIVIGEDAAHYFLNELGELCYKY